MLEVYTVITGTSGRTFTLAEIWEMFPVHPQDGRRPNFGQPVPCSVPGRIERNGTVISSGSKLSIISGNFLHTDSEALPSSLSGI